MSQDPQPQAKLIERLQELINDLRDPVYPDGDEPPQLAMTMRAEAKRDLEIADNIEAAIKLARAGEAECNCGADRTGPSAEGHLDWCATRAGEREGLDKGEISDGYHTFNELYEHRHALFAAVCADHNGWKSMLHEDGTMFDGWFIAGVMTPKGMATYHLPLNWWPKVKAHIVARAPKWDGHTAKDVPERIMSLELMGEREGLDALVAKWRDEADDWTEDETTNWPFELRRALADRFLRHADELEAALRQAKEKP